MKPDVLFWFYKDFDTCRERLLRLRSLNEGVRIFALYGGSLLETDMARHAIEALVDDFYFYPHEKDSAWKWRHGDQMIALWYRERGKNLQWDTIFVMQWDMLILDKLQKIFFDLKPGEMLLSGFRPLNSVSSWWSPANPTSQDLLSFKELLRDKFDYEGELFACLFIVVCLPRIFLEKYVAVGHPEIGFLEYKIPTMAHIFDIPVCNTHAFEPWWAANPATQQAPRRQRILNAVAQEVPRSVILQELSDRDGQRLFHPVFKHFPPWMENPSHAKLLSYVLQLTEAGSQSAQKLMQYVLHLTKRST